MFALYEVIDLDYEKYKAVCNSGNVGGCIEHGIIYLYSAIFL
jgi:hypothetical protein